MSRFTYGTGHYTQVVWADTEELGCGMVYSKVGIFDVWDLVFNTLYNSGGGQSVLHDFNRVQLRNSWELAR